uniref:Reverse transcriptase zinc-binding domain-containing protein n=1 Tax=Medicago truncatula TaxID=3880 RepID=Q1RU58_MEDTR|nr:hypothetical protein MtrDRAFT_AC153125g15v2 [Medicago truncatula]
MAIHNGQIELLAFVRDNITIATHVSKLTVSRFPLPDRFVWSHSSDRLLSAKDAFRFLHPPPLPLDWAATIWKSCIRPSHSFIFCQFMHNKLSTDGNLRRRGSLIVSVCSLSRSQAESSNHLFFECPCAAHLWD